MSDWITEGTHLPDPDEFVYATTFQSHRVRRVYGASFNWVDFIAWRPIETPDAYIPPPKSDRRVEVECQTVRTERFFGHPTEGVDEVTCEMIVEKVIHAGDPVVGQRIRMREVRRDDPDDMDALLKFLDDELMFVPHKDRIASVINKLRKLRGRA